MHGKIREYKRLLLRFTEPTLQLGDLGIGFREKDILGDYHDITLGKMDPKDKWFHGNHDDPNKCAKEEGYLGSYGITKEGIFFVAGAFSIDAWDRTVGISWWDNEQLSMEEFEAAKQLYTETKPDIVVTHDCPRSLYTPMLTIRHKGKPAPIFENTTAWFLESLLDIHKPKVWAYGHWHRAFDEEIGGTRFICLDELQPVTLEF